MSYYKDCRRAGKRLELGRTADGRYWRKRQGQTPTYFKYPDTRAGYESALSEYYALLQSRRPHAKEYAKAISAHEDIAIAHEVFGDTDAAAKVRAVVANLQTALATASPPELDRFTVDPLRFVSESGRAVMHEKIRFAKTKPAKPITKILGRAAAQFTEVEEGRFSNGEIRAATLEQSTTRLRPFREWFGDSTALGDLTTQRWLDWRNHVAKLSCGQIRKQYLYKASVSFVDWCLENDWIDLPPKNLKSKRLRFKVSFESPDIEDCWTPKEVKALLDVLSPRYKACVLLGLNCGFTNSDISYLTQKHLANLDDGRLIYIRRKTSRHKSLDPTNYKLWPKTVQAIKAARSGHDEWAFVTENGNQLVVDFVENSVRHKWDTISKDWGDLRRDGKIPDKLFKYFRKTGSTFIEDIEKGLEKVYLGHVVTDVSKHYNARDKKNPKPYKPLDVATDRLGKAFGMF